MSESPSPFAALVKLGSGAPLPAEDFVLVPPNAFSDRWKGKPNAEVAIGLRLIGDVDLDTAKAEGKKRALEMHDKPADEEGREACFRETVMQWVVSFAACDVNDRRRNYFEAAQDTVPLAFTAEGLRLVYDRYERFAIEQSCIDPTATDDDANELAARLAAGHLSQLDPAKQLRARKLLRFVLDDLRDEEPAGGLEEILATIAPPHTPQTEEGVRYARALLLVDQG